MAQSRREVHIKSVTSRGHVMELVHYHCNVNQTDKSETSQRESYGLVIGI